MKFLKALWKKDEPEIRYVGYGKFDHPVTCTDETILEIRVRFTGIEGSITIDSMRLIEADKETIDGKARAVSETVAVHR